MNIYCIQLGVKHEKNYGSRKREKDWSSSEILEWRVIIISTESVVFRDWDI